MCPAQPPPGGPRRPASAAAPRAGRQRPGDTVTATLTIDTATDPESARVLGRARESHHLEHSKCRVLLEWWSVDADSEWIRLSNFQCIY